MWNLVYLPEWVTFRIAREFQKCGAFRGNTREIGRLYKKIGLKSIDESRFLQGLERTWMEELYTALPKGL